MNYWTKNKFYYSIYGIIVIIKKLNRHLGRKDFTLSFKF